MFIETNQDFNRILFLLLLIPSLTLGQLLSEKDKQLHFLSGMVISSVTYQLVYQKTKNKKKAFIYSLGTGILAGALKEFVDKNEPNNFFDKRDLLATGFGSFTMSLTFDILKKGK